MCPSSEEETAWCVEDSYSSLTLCVCICVLPLCSQPLRGQCWSVAVQAFQRHNDDATDSTAGHPGAPCSGWDSLLKTLLQDTTRFTTIMFCYDGETPRQAAFTFFHLFSVLKKPDSFCLDADHLSPSWICPNNPSALFSCFQVHQDKTSWLSLLDLSLSIQDRLSPSHVKPVQVFYSYPPLVPSKTWRSS